MLSLLRSVIPPPPRYPTGNGMAPPPLETNNVLSNPDGTKSSLQVGEGSIPENPREIRL